MSTDNQISINGLHHISIQTIDWDRSLNLYWNILKMRKVIECNLPDKKLVLLDSGSGVLVELFSPRKTPLQTGGPLVHFALGTHDTRKNIEIIRQHGLTITMEPREVTLGDIKSTIAFFQGPNGESVEFFEVPE